MIKTGLSVYIMKMTRHQVFQLFSFKMYVYNSIKIFSESFVHEISEMMHRLKDRFSQDVPLMLLHYLRCMHTVANKANPKNVKHFLCFREDLFSK